MIDAEKCLKQKLYGSEGDIRRYQWFWVVSLRLGQSHINFLK